MKLRRKQTLISLLVTVLYVQYIDACGRGKGGKGKPDDGDNGSKPQPDNSNPPSNPSAVKNLLGPNVQTKPYDNSGYDGKNGQANSPDDLKCDFEGKCCWKNTKPPYDTMEWVQASGSPDPQKLQSNFGTSTAPTGNFMIVSSDNAAGPADKAEFESCAIACAGDSIKVTVKHWATQGVKMQVCEVAKSDPNTLLSCQDLPSSSPGPDTVTLPPGSDLVLSIVASGFTASGGSAAMIDDISVDYPPCSSTPQSTAPTSPGATTAAPTTAGPTQPPAAPDGSKNLCCGYEGGACGWKKGTGPSQPKGNVVDWQKCGPDKFKNPATGVPPSPDKAYWASYMKPKESAYTECDGPCGTDCTIKFQEYKATQDISLKACCDTEQGCTYDTGGKTEKGDFRQWYQGSIKCPAGTKKVIFYAENNGVNEGGVGIDNVQVFDANGNQMC